MRGVSKMKKTICWKNFIECTHNLVCCCHSVKRVTEEARDTAGAARAFCFDVAQSDLVLQLGIVFPNLSLGSLNIKVKFVGTDALPPHKHKKLCRLKISVDVKVLSLISPFSPVPSVSPLTFLLWFWYVLSSLNLPAEQSVLQHVVS